jgi:hypothetical protein
MRLPFEAEAVAGWYEHEHNGLMPEGRRLRE